MTSTLRTGMAAFVIAITSSTAMADNTPSAPKLKSAAIEPQPVGLLLPAVQAAREAARRPTAKTAAKTGKLKIQH